MELCGDWQADEMSPTCLVTMDDQDELQLRVSVNI